MALTQGQRELMDKLDFWKRERRIHQNEECDCTNKGACALRIGVIKQNIHDIVVKLNAMSKGGR